MRIFNKTSVCFLFIMLFSIPSVSRSAELSPGQSLNNVVEKSSGIQKLNDKSGHRKEISVFTLSSDGRYVFTGDEDENNFLWDVENGTVIRSIGKPDAAKSRVVAARFSPDGSNLLWVRYRKFMPVLWDVASGKRLGVLSSKEKGHLAEVVVLAFSGDGKFAATGDNQGTIVLWDMKDRTPVRKFKAHSGRISGLLFIPGRAEFVSAGDDGAVRLWMVARSLVTDLKEPGAGITALTAASDGSLIYAASADGLVRGWNINSRSLRATLTFNNRQINSISISPDGDFLALAEESESILVWNIHASKVAWQGKLDNSALQVKFSPNGKSLFTAGGDSWLREWDASSGRLLRKFGGIGE